MNSKKNWSKILLVLGVLIGVVGVSYALWRVSFSSTNDNSLTATCFNVSFTDQNNISIEKAYPLLDDDGKKLTPYEFTIINNCDTYVKYDINLEVLNTSTLTNMDYIKLMLDDWTPALVSSYNVTTKTLSNASTAYKINTGYLNANEWKTYNLRLWLDENVTGETEGVQNNTFTSKITVNASYVEEIPPPTAADDIVELAKTDTTNLAIDDYGNTRYIGKNPDNYISIDGDIWRIIGVMKNIDDGTGNKSDRVKIITSLPIGHDDHEGISWDTSDSSVNDGSGVNEWSQSKLMKLLNPGYESESIGGSLYWNNQSGTCYLESNDIGNYCDFTSTSTGIKDKLKTLISDAVWNIGASTTSSQIASKFYIEERGTKNGKICTSGDWCNDTVERTTTWTGKVGLMYPSDYGYATSGGDTTDRAACLNMNLDNWNSYSECYDNDWLYISDLDLHQWQFQWTLTPNAKSYGARDVFFVDATGIVSYSAANGNYSARPSAYLKPSVKISSGTGSESDPFELSL